MELAERLSECIDMLDTVVTDFEKRDIWSVPRRKWNSSMRTVPRHTLSAIHSIPGDVRVSMDACSRSIALAWKPLGWHKELRAVGTFTSDLEV